MRLIPGRTKVQIELFKGISIADIVIGGIGVALILLVLGTGFSGKFYICLGILLLFGSLLMRLDDEPVYVYLIHLLRHYALKRDYVNGTDEAVPSAKAKAMEEIIPFTGISDNAIEYAGKYYGAVIEIPPVEFRFFSAHRRSNSIENGVGRVLRSLDINLGGSIVKIERPMVLDDYINNEFTKIDALRKAYEQGMIKEDEMQTRVGVLYDRINELNTMNSDAKIIEPAYYLVLYAENKSQLEIQISNALDTLRTGEMLPKRLNDKELAVFLRYTNEIDFDEREINEIEPGDYVKWALPKRVTMTPRKVELNHIITHNFRLVKYPSTVPDAWLASPMSMPGTKVVIKFKPTDNAKAIRGIDRSLQELRGQYAMTGIDSKMIELQEHISTLSTLLNLLKGDNECLLDTNVYVTMYDFELTRKYQYPGAPKSSDRASIATMKKAVRRIYQENNLRVNGMDFNQVYAFIGSQISAFDPFGSEGRGMPSNTVASMYPWVYASITDKNGFKIGTSDGSPVFVDFFRRDSERVNSNMVIIGKSGSGKSYATKALLTNLAADDSKIFILDPENEYTDLAANLHGKFINVGNAQHGRLNPFHIITAIDDEDNDGPSGSYATHLQFLEEFFKQVLPDCERDALEYLNSLIDRTYFDKGITQYTDLSKLKPTDYPVFDDLYDEILKDFQQTDNEYLRTMLRTLINYVSKFASGGRNSNIWNGPASVTTDENFTVFNFQSLLANRNGTIANAQMLLVLKYIDNEIIKNRDYNIRYGCNRKIIVVIDEAHVFIDNKFPVALDFMFQLAKRIRKYNGMQIVITQNIKDFVGSEELARKSTAIINACQYSFIFALSPNDMTDLCKLYEKAGGINEIEQEQIISAARGQAFAVMSPTSRSTFNIEVPKDIVDIFSNPGYENGYFIGEEGRADWEELMGDSFEIREANLLTEDESDDEEAFDAALQREPFSFIEITEEEAEAEEAKRRELEKKKSAEDALLTASAGVVQTPQPAQLQEPVQVQSQSIPAQDDSSARTAAELRDMVREFSSVIEQMGRMNTEAMLKMSETVGSMGRMNYESIMDTISRLVDERTQKLSTQPGLQPLVQPVFDASQRADEISEGADTDANKDKGTDATLNAVLGNIFSAAAEEAEAESEALRDEEEDGDDDILSNLFSALQTVNSVSRIDMMDTFDEQIAAITLDELLEHIAIHKIR